MLVSFRPEGYIKTGFPPFKYHVSCYFPRLSASKPSKHHQNTYQLRRYDNDTLYIFRKYFMNDLLVLVAKKCHWVNIRIIRGKN